MKRPRQSDGTTMNRCQMRQDNRSPKKKGRVSRGTHAGLPHRDQTHTRDHLTWQDALVLVDAEQFAAKIKLPLTPFMTVAWKHSIIGVGRDASIWKEAFDKFRRVAREFLVRNHIPVAWVFAHERVSRVGGHTHFLMHIPERKWPQHVRGLELHLRSRCSMMSPFALSITASTPAGSISPRQRLGVIKYLCKSLNPKEELIVGAHSMGSLPDFLGIAPAHCLPLPEGLQRIGVSQNIGTQARREGGWTDMVNAQQLAEQTLRYGNTSLLRRRVKGC